MAVFTWTLPSAASAFGATGGNLATELDRLLGKDVWYDVSAATGPDTALTKGGDWVLVKRMEAVRQSLLRAYMTNPGEWVFLPHWGGGARLFVKRKNTRANRDLLATRLREQSLRDRRVASVPDVFVQQAGGGLVRFGVSVRVVGQIEQSKPMSIFGSLNEND